jgi:hypothetical protein
MEVTNVVENEDGSETWSLELTEDENTALIQYAFTDIMKKFIRNQEGEVK